VDYDPCYGLPVENELSTEEHDLGLAQISLAKHSPQVPSNSLRQDKSSSPGSEEAELMRLQTSRSSGPSTSLVNTDVETAFCHANDPIFVDNTQNYLSRYPSTLYDSSFSVFQFTEKEFSTVPSPSGFGTPHWSLGLEASRSLSISTSAHSEVPAQSSFLLQTIPLTTATYVPPIPSDKAIQFPLNGRVAIGRASPSWPCADCGLVLSTEKHLK
jgi:hypothetical protein